MGRWRVLCYHTVEADAVKSFARQLDWFVARGYRLGSFAEAYRALEGGEEQDWLTISFDDADWTLVENAQPVLDERGVRAILYLTTDYVIQGRAYRDHAPRRALTWDQLGHWIGSGHEVGGHTHTHVNLPLCSREEREDEWRRSQALIRNYLGVAADHFAYPWGQHNAEVRDHLQALGAWRTAATIDRGWNRRGTDPFQLHRDLISPEMTGGQIRMRVEVGGWPPLYKLQRAVRRFLTAAKTVRKGDRTLS